MSILLDASVWASAIRGATPILLAALGCLLCAKAGITNLAIDGFITVGCFISIAVVNITGGNVWLGILGGMIGTVYFGFMVSVIAILGIFHPYALGMASGVGAGILMASAVASLTEIYPAMADQISALASASETISGIDGIYMALFIGLPLCNWLYKVLEPRIGRFGEKRKQKKLEEK